MQIPIQSGDENIFHNKNPLNIEENIWVRVTGKAQIRFCGSHGAKSWRGRITIFSSYLPKSKYKCDWEYYSHHLIEHSIQEYW